MEQSSEFSEVQLQGLSEELKSMQDQGEMLYLAEDGSWGDGNLCIIFPVESLTAEEWGLMSQGTDIDRSDLYYKLVEKL
jgi:hypothetical protein